MLTIQGCNTAKRVIWLTGIFLFCAVFLCGCHGSDGSKVISADEPQRIVYYCWTGVSPGAGYTHTSLCAFEIDLVQGRARRLLTGRHAPQPMLSHQEKDILKRLASQPWIQLDHSEVNRILKLSQAWLRTNPPEVYSFWMGLGHEDGMAEKLTVFFPANSRSGKTKPWGKGPRPPDEWKNLIEAGIGLTGNDGTLSPAQTLSIR